MQPGESARDVLESQMLWEVQQGHTDANAKKLLLGLRLLEKFGWIPATVRACDWLFIDAFENVPLRKQEGRSKQWATMDCLKQLCTVAKTLQDWEVVSLAALSIAFGLGISEAFTAVLDEGVLTFHGTKG